MKTNTKQDQQTRQLARLIRLSFDGHLAELDQYSKQYLTAKGDKIVATAESHMDEAELLKIARRAINAGY